MKKQFLIVILLLTISANGQQSVPYQKVESNGLNVHYRVFGEGEPLLIIGGGPGDNADRYLSLAELLSNNFKCILVDQRGTGKSSPTVFDSKTISIALTLEDFEAIRKDLELNKWNIIGFSYGGFLASLYSHFYPNSISNLVLLGSMGLNTDAFGHFGDNISSRLQASDQQKYDFWSDSTRFAEDPKHALAEIVRSMMPGYFFDREKSLIVSEAIKDTDFDLMGMGELIWADIEKRNLDFSKMEQKFKGSVLILHGRQDPLGESVPLSINEYYKNSKLIFVEQCGHYSWVEQPEIISNNINEFIN